MKRYSSLWEMVNDYKFKQDFDATLKFNKYGDK